MSRKPGAGTARRDNQRILLGLVVPAFACLLATTVAAPLVSDSPSLGLVVLPFLWGLTAVGIGGRPEWNVERVFLQLLGAVLVSTFVVAASPDGRSLLEATTDSLAPYSVAAFLTLGGFLAHAIIRIAATRARISRDLWGATLDPPPQASGQDA